MANPSIRGQVVEATSRRPVADVRVEAWILDPARSKLVGAAQSTADGAFTIKVEEGAVRDERTEIYFKVLRGDRTLADTRSQVLWTSKTLGRVILPVSDPKSNDAEFRVAGTVTTEVGAPVVGVRVEAWDQQLGGETLLATGVTGDKGGYAI